MKYVIITARIPYFYRSVQSVNAWDEHLLWQHKKILHGVFCWILIFFIYVYLYFLISLLIFFILIDGASEVFWCYCLGLDHCAIRLVLYEPSTIWKFVNLDRIDQLRCTPLNILCLKQVKLYCSMREVCWERKEKEIWIALFWNLFSCFLHIIIIFF